MPQLKRFLVLLAAAVIAAIGASTLTLAVLQQHGSSTAAGAALRGDATWSPRSRPAPTVSLPDQSGRPVSLAAEHGHIVLLTFLYSHCRELCPTVGAELTRVQHALPAADQPVIVVISLDPVSDTPDSVRSFAANVGWAGRWYWLLGSARQLSPVWRAYGIDVQRSGEAIAHSGAVYLVDRQGYERSGFLAPFLLPDVEHDVAVLSATNPSDSRWLAATVFALAALAAGGLVAWLRTTSRQHPDAGAASRPAKWLARPATTVAVTAGLAVALTLGVEAQRSTPARSAGPAGTAATGPASGGVIPVAARRMGPALDGTGVLVPPRITLAAERGRIVFVNFWASWCAPCRQEAPAIARFARALPRAALFVGVDTTDQRGDALAFIRQFHLTYPMLWDGRGLVMRRFSLVGLPTTAVVDRHGRIAVLLLGPQTTATLQAVWRTLEPES